MPASSLITHDSFWTHDYSAGGDYFLYEPVGLELLGCEILTWNFDENVNFCDACKMEQNYNALRMVQLRALPSEHGLRGYSKLRKADLIDFLWDNLQSRPTLNLCLLLHNQLCFNLVLQNL